MRASLIALAAVLIVGFSAMPALAQSYPVNQPLPQYAWQPNCDGGYGVGYGWTPQFCPNGPPTGTVPPYSVPCPSHSWFHWNHGLATFPTHPYARSPRDFFMIDDP